MTDARSIFFAAMDREPHERPAFLAQACGQDLSLRAEVENLLSQLNQVGDFLDKPVLDPAHSRETPRVGALEELPGDVSFQAATPQPKAVGNHPAQASPEHRALPELPGYRVLEEIARGGMGVVYRAQQISAQRIVALKMILGDQGDSTHLERFRTEVESVARLQHPGIVQIFDVGEYQGKPYFSMEYCPGGSLAQYLSGTPLPAQQTVALLAHLSEAVQAAHNAQVIHRDLKPANVLLAPGASANTFEETLTGTPPTPTLSDYVAKVTDFGLAKKLDDATLTRTGMVMGTPSYMSPEQAQGNKHIGPPTDVYALGTILYECLTGRPPFNAATAVQTVQQVLHDDPVPPRRLQPAIPRDVETICLKCLQKEPARRYPSARAFAQDLQAFLADKPITARPVGPGERTIKWARRHPALASTIGVSVLALLFILGGGAFFTTSLMHQITLTREAEQNAIQYGMDKKKALERTEAAETLARKRADKAEALVYANHVKEAHRAWNANNVDQAQSELASCQRYLRGGEWEYHYLRHLFYEKGPHLLGRHNTTVQQVSWSRDGRFLATGTQTDVKLWDARRQQLMVSIQDNKLSLKDLCCSPDGEHLAIAKWDGLVKIWSVKQGKVVQTFGQPGEDILNIAYSPDGKLFAAVGHSLQVWDVQTGKRLYQKTYRDEHFSRVQFNENGTRIAFVIGGLPTQLKVCQARDGKEIRSINPPSLPGSVHLSRNGQQVAGVLGMHEITIWDVDRNREIRRITPPQPSLAGVQFGPDDRGIACASNNTIILWQSWGAKVRQILRGSRGQITSWCFSPDGKQILSGNADGIIHLWDLQKSRNPIPLRNKPNPPVPFGLVSYSRPMSLCAKHNLLAVGDGSFIHVWDLNQQVDREILTGSTTHISAVSMSGDGRHVAGVCTDRVLRIWDIRTGKIIQHMQLPGGVSQACFSPDGKTIAVGGFLERRRRNHQPNSVIQLWSLSTRKKLLQFEVHSGPIKTMRYSPAGQYLATCGVDNTVKIWEVQKGRLQFTLQGPKKGVFALGFNREGNTLASGGWGNVTLWDVHTAKQRSTLVPQGSERVWSVAFSPDGKRLLAGFENSIQIWNVQYGTHLMTLAAPNSPPFYNSAVFTSDGSSILTYGKSGLLLWEGKSQAAIPQP